MNVGNPSLIRPAQVAVQQLRVPNLNAIDFGALRAGRLRRMQDSMRRNGVAVALFYNPANIRYATGTDMMGVWSASTLERHCILPATGEPIVFEYRTARHVTQRIVKDVRPEVSWQMAGPVSAEIARGWAATIKGVMSELGCHGEALAIDKLDPFGFLALQDAGIRIIDAGPVYVEAREVKTAQEIELFTINGAIGDAMLADFDAAIRPGIREYELLAVLSNTLQRFHGECLFARLIASGSNTNPWMSEAHDKIIQPGDLVGVDTDANGYEGYVIDVSRTFLCGDHAMPGQREAYKIAYDCVNGMVDLIRPGMTYGEFMRKSPELPDAYKANRYSIMGHQAGLEDEGPLMPYLYGEHHVPKEILDWEIKENSVFCFECYAGKEGAPYGVKLEEQVLVTKQGGVRLSVYPFEAKLL
jgi:Xaa-Pro aminopeptidase